MSTQSSKPPVKYLVAAAVLLPLTMAIATPALADRDHDYEGQHGYREHPYNKQRHHERYEYKGHQYDYRGHWRSWHEWDDYYRGHPELHKHGGYYREEGRLMFRFCNPDTGGCFFFSIGM